METKENVKIDLLLICGDFQVTTLLYSGSKSKAIRNETDLHCMAVPDKFKDMGTFYKYYTGEAVAPLPTIFIGGNHEASNFLQELYVCPLFFSWQTRPYGGWIAPNIYFMGYAGVVNFAGIRIAGISGIYKGQHYELGEYTHFFFQHRKVIMKGYHMMKTKREAFIMFAVQKCLNCCNSKTK